MLTFGIQIMKTGEAFDFKYPVLMWNDIEGVVEVDLRFPEATFTVYSTGSQAMYTMSNISGYGTRLVNLPSNLFPATNNNSRGARGSTLEFQLRDAQTSSTGRDRNLFWDFTSNRFSAKGFSSTKGDSSISKTSAVNLRDLNFGIGSVYELIQQTYNPR